MRLTTQEITKLSKAIEEFLILIHNSRERNSQSKAMQWSGDCQAELRLFGSRVENERKGGDIDLLLVIFDQVTADQLNAQKHLLLARMKQSIGDQKIDLKIVHQDELQSDAFLQLIYPKSIVLHTWP